MLLNRERADALMDAQGAQAIVATTMINVHYLTGWATDASWGFGDLAVAILPRDHDRRAAVLTVETDAGMPQQTGGPWTDVVVPYRRKPGIGPGGKPMIDDVAETLAVDQVAAVALYLDQLSLRGTSIAFEDRGLGIDVAAHLDGSVEVLPARDLLRDIRMVKTAEELARTRAAARKTEIGLRVAVEAVAGGATTGEAERAYWSVVPTLGARPIFLLIQAFRPGHGALTKDAQLQPGDTVTFDATAAVGHYTSDIGRTAIVGEPTDAQVLAFDAVRVGWRNAWSEIRPGRSSDDLEAIIVGSVNRAGNSHLRGCSVHSVGMEHTDHPHPHTSLQPFELVAGMVLSCDLPWREDTLGKFHVEDLLLVSDDHVELLNTADNRLFVCVDGRAERAGRRLDVPDTAALPDSVAVGG